MLIAFVWLNRILNMFDFLLVACDCFPPVVFDCFRLDSLVFDCIHVELLNALYLIVLIARCCAFIVFGCFCVVFLRLRSVVFDCL